MALHFRCFIECFNAPHWPINYCKYVCLFVALDPSNRDYVNMQRFFNTEFRDYAGLMTVSIRYTVRNTFQPFDATD